ncbi:hypothetical protein Xcc3_42780 [Xanthomonas campestris pv. campestris]|nr:hypothetical protein Xcc3_42780 [Xanthomonas campestris pv. campestris]
MTLQKQADPRGAATPCKIIATSRYAACIKSMEPGGRIYQPLHGVPNAARQRADRTDACAHNALAAVGALRRMLFTSNSTPQCEHYGNALTGELRGTHLDNKDPQHHATQDRCQRSSPRIALA